MLAKAGIQKIENNPGFLFPAFARTSFTGMTKNGNKSLALLQTTDSIVSG
jgi:hypothetical protein